MPLAAAEGRPLRLMPPPCRTTAHSHPSQLLPPSLAHHILRLALFLLVAVIVLPSTPASQSAAQPTPNVSYTALSNDHPVSGSLPASATAYFQWTAPAVAYEQTTLVSVSASTGSPLLFVSFASSPAPSASSFAYSASWQTGGVVAIGQQQQPPYTLYVAVQASAWSACNYTLLVEAYDSAAAQSTAIALSSAVPLASAIAAGEYRYYTYNVSEGTDVVTVALTETYGQCWQLLNDPDNAALPTLDDYQYASSSLAFPLVPLLQPTVGVWTVGVWSDKSAAFSIIAADSTDTQPMELGVAYPGYVQGYLRFAYYSIYIDDLQLAAYSGYLDIELQLVTDYSSVCCSSTSERPGYRNCEWQSRSDYAYNRILIPTADLSAGTIYCGVVNLIGGDYYTNRPTTFVISASYGSAVTLTAGDTATAQSPAGGSQLYSLVFPAAHDFITLSVVSDVGQAALYIGAYGPPPTYRTALIREPEASQQLEQLSATLLCGDNNSLAIPGSSPPLCQMQVLVTTSSLTVYAITASTSGEIVQLIAGQPVEGAVTVGQRAWYSFYIEDELSNITLAVTVTDGASSLTLTIGLRDDSKFSGDINPLRSFTQQLNSDVLLCQLSYTDPLLPSYGFVRGEYVAVLSATADPATFSIVYSVTSGSDYTIVQLLDGVPQAALVDVSIYSFYYFQPPAAGWPYAVTIDVVGGYDTVRAVTSNGPVVGPTTHQQSLAIGRAPLVLKPSDAGICDPSINTTCGYSIGVQGNRYQGYTEQYTITVTTGHWMRDLYVNSAPQPGALLAVGDSDYWLTLLAVPSWVNSPQIVYTLLVTSGSVSAFGSQVTPEPNATNADQAWTNVSSVAVLFCPISRTQLRSPRYLTVTCTSIDSTPCQYTLQVVRYDEDAPVTTLSFSDASQPVSVLLPAGRMKWLAYKMDSNATLTALSFLIVQAAVTIGTPSLYGLCNNYRPSITPLPTEEYHTWQATTAPLAIELFRFNASAASCPSLIVGVLASGGKDALLDVSVTTAGQVQKLGSSGYGTGSAVGVSTADSPVSYWSYTLTDSDVMTVLSFMLASTSSVCTISQLQMVISDVPPFLNVSDPFVFSFHRSAVTLPNGVTDLAIAITSFSTPAGSLRDGYYYVAVSSAASVACQYTLLGSVAQQRQLPLGQLAAYGLLDGAASYFTLAPVPYNTSASLAVQLPGNTGVVALYVAVDNTPSPADPSTYLLSAVYDSTQAGTSGMYVAQPVYVPASACASPATVGQACTVVVMAVSSVTSQSVYLQAMSSANAVQLLPGVSITTPSLASKLATTFQLSLPASPLLATLSLNTSSPLTVWCSYQYVTPDARFNEWQWQVGNGCAASTSSQLSFAWSTAADRALPLQTNPSTQLAELSTSCYCTVQALSFEPYSLTYTTAPLSPAVPPTPTPSSSTSTSTQTATLTAAPNPTSTPTPAPDTQAADKHGGLSGGALAVAVVVPVVVVLLLVALMLVVCVRRSGGGDGLCCCGEVLSKRRSGGDIMQTETETGERGISMTELSRNTQPRQADGLISERWSSDRE